MRTFIPQKKVDNPNFLSSMKTFGGDNRTAYQANATTYRTEQSVSTDFDKKSMSLLNNTASSSVGYDKDGKKIATSDPTQAGVVLGNVNDFKNSKGKPDAATLNFQTDAVTGLQPLSPAINADLTLTIKPNSDGSFNFNVSGSTDGFPAYELWVKDDKGNSYLLLNSNPQESGKSPMALYPPEDQKYNYSGNSKDLKKGEVVKFTDTKNTKQTN